MTGWRDGLEPWSPVREGDRLYGRGGAASLAYFGAPAVLMGESRSIPFMGMLGELYPEAQFLVTGVLGPASNAHGPNEFLHIPTGQRVTCCVADVLHAHASRPDGGRPPMSS